VRWRWLPDQLVEREPVRAHMHRLEPTAARFPLSELVRVCGSLALIRRRRISSTRRQAAPHSESRRSPRYRPLPPTREAMPAAESRDQETPVRAVRGERLLEPLANLTGSRARPRGQRTERAIASLRRPGLSMGFEVYGAAPKTVAAVHHAAEPPPSRDLAETETWSAPP